MEPVLIASAVLALGRWLIRGAGSSPQAVVVAPGPSVEVPPALPPYFPPPVAPPARPLPDTPPNRPQRDRIDAPPPPEAPGSPIAPLARTSTSATTPDRSQVAPPTPGATPSGPQVKDRARLDQAAEAAKSLAPMLKKQGRATSRKTIAAFQRLAGLVADGVYGPKSAGALQWYTGEAIPPFTGKGFAPYAPAF